MCSEQDAQVHKAGEPQAVFDHKLHTSDWVNELFRTTSIIFSLQTKFLDFSLVFIKVSITKYFRSLTKYFRSLSFSFSFFLKLNLPPSGTKQKDTDTNL